MRAIYPSFRAIAVSSNASKRQVFSHIIKTPCVEVIKSLAFVVIAETAMLLSWPLT